MKTRALLVFCFLVLAGCDVIPPPQSDQTQYYVLNAETPPAPKTGGTLRVGMRRIELPGYLRTPDIVLRRGSNEIAPQDFSRWGEPLEAALDRVVRVQLEASPAVGRLYAQPFPLDSDRDYDVAVEIDRCEGGVNAGGAPVAQLSATIEVIATGPDSRIVARETYAPPDIPWNGRDFGQLAADLSRDAAGLGHAAAALLTSAPPPPAPAPDSHFPAN
jgi:uncharacterized lipoprotein YmbA